ncbi:MAG: hypothetical protein IKJ95_00580 [Bacteroidaceae bacterium]|nr:hypothetical protein [Bacteroidaceae bacterium]
MWDNFPRAYYPQYAPPFYRPMPPPPPRPPRPPMPPSFGPPGFSGGSNRPPGFTR